MATQSARTAPARRDTFAAAALRIIIPAVWLGLIMGISLIEAPLKFQAPGITIPLGLGIGKLVFTAMNAVEIVLAVILLWAVVRRPLASKIKGAFWAAITILGIKVAIIRPLLNQRTEAVLAGKEAGGSMTHLFYIAADGLLIVCLVTLLVLLVRASVRPMQSTVQ